MSQGSKRGNTRPTQTASHVDPQAIAAMTLGLQWIVDKWPGENQVLKRHKLRPKRPTSANNESRYMKYIEVLWSCWFYSLIEEILGIVKMERQIHTLRDKNVILKRVKCLHQKCGKIHFKYGVHAGDVKGVRHCDFNDHQWSSWPTNPLRWVETCGNSPNVLCNYRIIMNYFPCQKGPDDRTWYHIVLFFPIGPQSSSKKIWLRTDRREKPRITFPSPPSSYSLTARQFFHIFSADCASYQVKLDLF